MSYTFQYSFYCEKNCLRASIQLLKLEEPLYFKRYRVLFALTHLSCWTSVFRINAALRVVRAL